MNTNLFARALTATYDRLSYFADRPDFLDEIASTFGQEFDRVKLVQIRQQWLAGQFESLPQIEIVSADVLGTAQGAYGASTDRIYLSQTLFERGDELSIGSILTEEIGHWLDARINFSDTPGDEGQLFAARVWEQDLSAVEVSAIRSEDDSATIVIDGRSVVEMIR
jgi:hypothetical protein